MVGLSLIWLLPFLLAGEHHSCVAAFLPMRRLEHGTRASQHKSVQQFHLPSTALPFTRSASTKLNAVSDLLIAVDIPELAKLFVACSVTASLALGAVAVTSLIFKIALFVAKDVVKTWKAWTSYLTTETAEIPPISLNAVRETSFPTVTLITPKNEDVNSTVDASGSLSVVTKSVHPEASMLGIAYYEGTLGSSETLDAEAKPDVRTEMPWKRRNLRAMKFPPAEATTSTSGTSVLRVTLAFEENPADISSVAFALDRLVPIKPTTGIISVGSLARGTALELLGRKSPREYEYDYGTVSYTHSNDHSASLRQFKQWALEERINHDKREHVDRTRTTMTVVSMILVLRGEEVKVQTFLINRADMQNALLLVAADSSTNIIGADIYRTSRDYPRPYLVTKEFQKLRTLY
jgi:hypothetical protein